MLKRLKCVWVKEKRGRGYLTVSQWWAERVKRGRVTKAPEKQHLSCSSPAMFWVSTLEMKTKMETEMRTKMKTKTRAKMRTRLRMLISRQADRKSLAKKPLVPVTVLNFNLAHKHADRASSSAYNILQYSSSNVYNILLTNTSTDIHKVPQCSTVAHLCM